MKKVLCGTFIIFFFVLSAAELLMVHVNDTWEYCYEKTSIDYSGSGPVGYDTINGIFVLKIDSIKNNPDSDTQFLYITKSDSLWSNNKTGIPAIRASHQLLYKTSGDTMLSSGNTGLSTQPLYFAFWQLPDAERESDSEKFERKTIVRDTSVNSTPSKIRTQTSSNSQLILTSQYYYSIGEVDTLIWIDSIGVFQHVSQSSQSSGDGNLITLTRDKSVERITLMKRNGKEIDLLKASTVSTPFKGIKTNNGLTKKARYYSINGCLQNKISSSQMGSRLIVQVNPDNQSCVEKIVQLFK